MTHRTAHLMHHKIPVEKLANKRNYRRARRFLLHLSTDVPVLIPSYNPDKRLLELVDSLKDLGVEHIIVVNDGSAREHDPIFQKLAAVNGCTVLRHAVNCGKGRALKTGLNYFYLAYPYSPGIVTADGDAQHRPGDIFKIRQEMLDKPGSFILGVRKFGRDIPFRSLFGNTLTRGIFYFLTGKKLSDTQCGLRGLPRHMIPNLIRLRGERYEYEINMLILTKEEAIDLEEQEIETVYLDNNSSSHFNPLLDSMRIYFQLLRFTFSSLLASFFDLLFFIIAFDFTAHILASMLIGRFIVGSLLNYIVNKRLVFRSKAGVLHTLWKYYLALVGLSLLSWVLIKEAVFFLRLGVVPAKILVESLLFLLSFFIQREFVFFGREKYAGEGNRD